MAEVTKSVVKEEVKKVSDKVGEVKKVAEVSKAQVEAAREEVKSAKKEAKIAKKEVTKAKTELKKAKKVASKAHKVNLRQDAEIEKLKKAILELQKKKRQPARHISEYNLFIRKQIKAGLSFTEAVREWKKYLALQKKNKKKPSAYNQFIGSQMRLGKTFKQAVALWKLAKAGKLGKKGSTKTITKTIVKRVKVQAKPKIKYRTRTLTKTIVKKVKSKPKVIIKKVRTKPIVKTITKTVAVPSITINEIRQAIESALSKTSISTTTTKTEYSGRPSDEEVAFIIVEAYFRDVARFGVKKQLTLDEVINAYLYALARVKRQDIEMTELAKALKESQLRK